MIHQIAVDLSARMVKAEQTRYVVVVVIETTFCDQVADMQADS